MGAYMLNEALFTHSHITEDGSVITHAHPYDRSDTDPFKHHQHSHSELMVFAAVKLLFVLTGFAMLFVIHRPVFSIVADTQIRVDQHLGQHLAGRSPPNVSVH